jgi:hypothetical protein
MKKKIDNNENEALNKTDVSSSTVYLTSENYYGDGQFYFKCNGCGEELCGRRTETIECICGHNTDCIYDYE